MIRARARPKSPASAAASLPKLAVAPVSDAAEHEAERVAERIVAAPAPIASPLRIQRAPGPAASARPADPAAARAAAAVAGGGQPLQQAERAYFEPRFGRDLSAVRLHADSAAAAAARGIGARAYTLRNHIAFGSGELRPGTGEGRRILAHELTHTLQQSAAVTPRLQRLCSDNATCSAASIPGDPSDFSRREAQREARGRARRQRMSPDRARSTGHAGRAAQLETILSAHDPSRRELVHGIFIDRDISRSTDGMLADCSRWAGESLPAGDPDPDSFAAATKPCMLVPARLNRQARRFNEGARRVGGQRRTEWLREALQVLVHETEHERFDTAIQPGLAQPAAVTTATCIKSALQFPLSEVVAITSEFKHLDEAARAEASATGPAHRQLGEYFANAVHNPHESFTGALTAMGCKCECFEVDAFVRQAVDAITSSWTDAQKALFRSEIQSRMPAAPGPAWPMAPSP